MCSSRPSPMVRVPSSRSRSDRYSWRIWNPQPPDHRGISSKIGCSAYAMDHGRQARRQSHLLRFTSMSVLIHRKGLRGKWAKWSREKSAPTPSIFIFSTGSPVAKGDMFKNFAYGGLIFLRGPKGRERPRRKTYPKSWFPVEHRVSWSRSTAGTPPSGAADKIFYDVERTQNKIYFLRFFCVFSAFFLRFHNIFYQMHRVAEYGAFL